MSLLTLAAASLVLVWLTSHARAVEPGSPPVGEDRTRGWVAFESFTYRGEDPYAARVPADGFLNPIVAGFYPDPSVCRVGDDFYLVNSTFAYFPGVPIFKSRDLIHWRQIGHVLDRPSQLHMGTGMGVSSGIYAPTISHHAGKFYMVTTLVGGGGNFYVTADRAEGPWSDPIWLRDVHGIDPSFFFDDDGKVYLLNNGGPPDEKPLYDGHRAIWMQEMDLAAGKPIGPRHIVINGGVDISTKPHWIEGPHLLKKDGWYILHAAEGGTGPGHSQVVFRSRDVWGPYVPWDQNPILTQRDLPYSRPDPVTCIGHADLVETPGGEWWAVFLGCRPDGHGHELTGRETFLLPVRWIDGWPRVLDPKTVLPRTPTRPALPPSDLDAPATTGTVEFTDDFASPTLDPRWLMLRTPTETWYSLSSSPGALCLEPRAEPLTARGNPSYLGRRVQHSRFTVETTLHVGFETRDADAGLATFQHDRAHYFFVAHVRDGSAKDIVVERVWDRDRKDNIPPERESLATATLPNDCRSLQLQIRGEGVRFSFAYRTDFSAEWITLLKDTDATFLSTRSAGGFVGVTAGPHVRLP